MNLQHVEVKTNVDKASLPTDELSLWPGEGAGLTDATTLEFYRSHRGEWAVTLPTPGGEPGLSPRLVIEAGTARLERGGSSDPAAFPVSLRVVAKLATERVGKVTVAEFEGGEMVRWYQADVAIRRDLRCRAGQGRGPAW